MLILISPSARLAIIVQTKLYYTNLSHRSYAAEGWSAYDKASTTQGRVQMEFPFMPANCATRTF
jgi:hypothetical protein